MHLHRRFKEFIILIIVVAVTGITVTLQPVTAKPNDASFSATLEPLAGLVQYLPVGKANWETLNQITLIHEGDQIRTGDLGAARLSTVTGIKVEIYPTTLLQVRILALSDGTTGSLSFRLSQVVGVTYMNIEQALKPSDRVQIITPAAMANIYGTRLYTFASRTGDTAFFGDQHRFLAASPIGQTFTNEQDYISFFPLSEPVAQCTIAFLKENSKGSLLTELHSPSGRKLLGAVLTSFLPSNVHSRATNFLSRVLGFTESKTAQEVLDGLNSLDKPMEMPDFMTDFRSFMRAYFAYLSSGTLPLAACGNGRVDAGETAQTCAVDAVDISATMGNKLCETEKGESLINDTPDCIPSGAFMKACEDLIDQVLGGHEGPLPGLRLPTNTPKPGQPTNTPWPTPTTEWHPPQPSGVG